MGVALPSLATLAETQFMDAQLLPGPPFFCSFGKTGGHSQFLGGTYDFLWRNARSYLDFWMTPSINGCPVEMFYRRVWFSDTRWWNRWVCATSDSRISRDAHAQGAVVHFQPSLLGLVINPNLSQDFFIWLSESQRRPFCREPNAQGILGRTKVVVPKLGSPKPQFCCFGTNIFWLNHTFCCLNLNLWCLIIYPFFCEKTHFR